MVESVADGVWRISCLGVNAYLVDDDGALTLVDAGTPWDAGRIRAGVADAGFALGDVERVLVTHYDLDHVGALAALDDELSATVYAGEPDGRLLQGTRELGFRPAKAALTRLVTTRLVDRPDLPVEFVAGGDSVGSFEVFETPGHTPGHRCFVSEPLAVGVLGDLARGAGDGDLARLPRVVDWTRERAGRSIREFADRAPAFEVALVGHGDPLSAGGRDAVRALAARIA